VFARTMPHCPHEYTVTQTWAPVDERLEFEAAVMFIREHGVSERFERNRYRKLEVDGWKFWSMGWPAHQTIIINRAHVDWVAVERPEAMRPPRKRIKKAKAEEGG
jgi:hypothetical protein